jgi:hypothetical protein
MAVVAAGVLVSGEAVGACANELTASAREEMQVRMNLFIVDDLIVGCFWRPIWIQLFHPAAAIKKVARRGRLDIICFPLKTAGVAQW